MVNINLIVDNVANLTVGNVLPLFSHLILGTGNNNQKNQIVNLLIEIRDSGALKDGNFKQQASKLSSQIQNGAKNIFNKFNTQENRNWLQNLWDQIVKFFSGLFGGVILN